MWYRTSKKSINEEKGVDAKILRSAAQRAVRRHLRLKGNYQPSPQEIHQLAQRILLRLQERYKNLEHVRTFAGDDHVAQVVDKIAEEIFHLK